jgi:hypothetical protein
VSTSRRRPVIPGSSSSAAPWVTCRNRESGPKAGRNPAPGRAAYNVVPDPCRSGTNASGQDAAARSATAISPGRNAGRSPDRAATPDPGHWRAAQEAPNTSASLSPACGSSGTMVAPTAARSLAATGSSVTAITRSPTGDATTALIVSETMARASSARREPARGAIRDLARASTLTGTTTAHVNRASSDICVILPRHRITSTGRLT